MNPFRHNFHQLAAATLSLVALVHLTVLPVRAETDSEKPVSFSFNDQHQNPMVLKPDFPKPMIVAVADKEGADQLEAWIQPLKKEFGDRVDFFAIADVRPVPGPLKGMVRRGFRKEFAYPVAMDWEGVAVKRLNTKPDVANLILLNRRGLVTKSVHGPAEGENLAQMTAAIRPLLQADRPPPAELDDSTETE